MKNTSPLELIIKGLVPYTEANRNLAFRPSLFFRELEALSAGARDEQAYRQAFYRLVRKGYISTELGLPVVTEAGHASLKLFKPRRLGKSAKLMIVFDIPESERAKRDRLRYMLIQVHTGSKKCLDN